MDDYFLDLRDTPRVVDFLVETSAYADEKQRGEADMIAKKHHDGEKIDMEDLADAAIELGWNTWPARTAVAEVLAGERSEKEWASVIAAVRPSTAHILERFRKASGAKTLDDVLGHEEVETALRDEERLEIGEVRKHVREDFWKTHAASLEVIVKTRQKERDAYKKLLEQLRELAAAFPPVMQDEVFSKVKRYEDRIIFAGETLPMEILEKEIQYYVEQKEISPLEQG